MDSNGPAKRSNYAAGQLDFREAAEGRAVGREQLMQACDLRPVQEKY
jgi:hypothetical protein